ncbi:hypothetical protein RRG08_019160 [Elysia crispata]|uniref:Uncharacterized protein n=1 Tax=Elysia crispata TaxID=231223 RepID=A0AAE1BCK3_9GAST|nr:hypothetical protein RRG08_019160 [Elysia crispata]
MPLRVYYDLMSQPSRAVYMFLRLNNVPFEAKPVALRKGEHFGEEYKKINPFSLVPAIDDDGFKLTESIAIVKYMIQERGLSDHWFPAKNPKKQARVEEYLHWYHANTRLPSAMLIQHLYLIGKYDLHEHWYPRQNLEKQARVEEFLHWQHLNTRFLCASLFQNLLIIPRATGKPIDLAAAEKFRKKVSTMVTQLEGYFLNDRKYLAGDEISIADIFGACELMQLFACQEHRLFESSPTVKAWMERVKKDTNPHFDEAHKMIYRTNSIYNEIAAKL